MAVKGDIDTAVAIARLEVTTAKLADDIEKLSAGMHDLAMCHAATDAASSKRLWHIQIWLAVVVAAQGGTSVHSVISSMLGVG